MCYFRFHSGINLPMSHGIVGWNFAVISYSLIFALSLNCEYFAYHIENHVLQIKRFKSRHRWDSRKLYAMVVKITAFVYNVGSYKF